MSVKATMRPRGDQGPVAVEQQADSRPPPSWVEAATASLRLNIDDDEAHALSTKIGGYKDVENALVETGVSRDRYRKALGESYLGQDFNAYFDQVWGDVERARKADPKRFAELPRTRGEFDQWVLNRKGAHQLDAATAARGGFGTSIVPGLGFGLLTGFQAENLPMMAMGGGASSTAGFVVRQALAGAQMAAMTAPQVVRARAERGESTSVGDLARDVGIGAGANAVFAGTFAYGPKVAGRAGRAVYEAVASPDWQRAQAFKRAVRAEWRTTDQQAAIHVIERAHEIAASNPFARTYAGVDAHAARIEATIADFHEPPSAGFVPKPADAVRPQEPGRARVGTGSLDRAVVGFFRNKGYSEAQARGIAAGIHAESGSNPLARNPDSGALGIGQWLGPRKRAIIARYGENPTLEQQLEFLHGELQGGDPGGRKVLAQADEGAVLRSYIEDFMRPAKGRETTGDLERGMAALGRAGEAPAAGEPGLAGIDLGEDGGPVVRPEALDAVRPDVPDETPELRPEVVDDALVTGLRGLVADPAVSLNRLPELASALDAGEDQVRRALARLADEGAVTITKSGQVRRAGGGGVRGPDDALRFVARSGGISYHGLDARTRAIVDGPKGHDLRNTGSLAAFIPGGGPLLRPEGRTLDEVAEALWDAGYFGPPETTPRPSDVDVIEFLDQSLRTKQKRYSHFDTAPEKKATAADFDEREGAPRAVADEAAAARGEAATRAQWDAAAERAGIVPLFPHEIAAAQRIMAEGTDVLPPLAADPLPSPEALAPYLLEMVNREIDDVLEASYLEVEDPRYDTFLADYADDPAGQAGGAAGGGERPAADRGDAAAGGAGADPGSRDYPDELSPGERDAAEAAGELPPTPFDEPALERFDDPVGDGAAKAADDAWHDVKAQQADPNIAALDRQKAKLGAASPMRGRVEQDGTGGLGLFDTANEPTFDLGDGQGPRKLSEIEAELAADKDAIDTIESCMTPPAPKGAA